MCPGRIDEKKACKPCLLNIIAGRVIRENLRYAGGSKLIDFRSIRLKALQHLHEAFGASYKEWHRKPER